MNSPILWIIALSGLLIAGVVALEARRRLRQNNDSKLAESPAPPPPEKSVDKETVETVSDDSREDLDTQTDTDRWAKEVANRVTQPASLRHQSARLIWIEIFAELDDETCAWIGEESSFGFSPKSVFGYEGVQKGDAIRALVTSKPWHHAVEATDPATVRRVNDRIRLRKMLEFERQRRFHSWHDFLKPGDLVVARVPYGPHGKRKFNIGTGKHRPAVFVRFQDDFLVVRGIFTAGRYEERERQSPRLRDPQKLLKNASVVGTHEQELAVTAVHKKIGRLSDIDLRRLGFTQSSTAESDLSDSRAGRLAEAFIASHSFPKNPASLEVLAALIRKMVRSPEHETQLLENGIYLSEIGQVMSIVRDNLDVSPTIDSLKSMVQQVLKDNEELRLAYQVDAPGSERIISRRSSDAPPDGPAVPVTPDRSPVRHDATPNWRPLDYESPALIIMDQLWMHRELGDRRLDFGVMAESLRELGSGRILWLGPAVTPGLQSLQNSIRARGWDVMGSDSRDGDIELAVTEALPFVNQPVAVVSGADDLLLAIEQTCQRVFIIDEIHVFTQ